MEKIETLENIIADRLRVIGDLDAKLQQTRSKKTHTSADNRQPTASYPL